MDVFGIFIVVSFVCLILTLVIMNIVNKAKITQERTNRKSLGLTKERAERISLKTEQAYLDKYPVLSVTCDSVDDSWCQRSANEVQEKYLETVPSHKTRVALRKKRQRKK